MVQDVVGEMDSGLQGKRVWRAPRGEGGFELLWSSCGKEGSTWGVGFKTLEATVIGMADRVMELGYGLKK